MFDRVRILLAGALVAGLLPSNAHSQQHMWKYVGGPGGTPVASLAIGTNGRTYALGMSQIALSTDRGLTWTETCNILPEAMNTLLALPDGSLLAGAWSGVRRSSDDGATWQKTGLNWGSIVGMAWSAPNNIYAASRDYGVYISLDNGAHWLNPTQGLTTQHITCIAVHPNGTIFAGTSDYGMGVFGSTDHGVSWVNMSGGNSNNPLGVWDIAVAADGSVIVAANALYRSTNNGGSWDSVGRGDINALLAVSPDGLIYARTDAFYRSSDNGKTWVGVNWHSGNVYDIAADSSQRVYTAFYEGVGSSSDAGTTWTLNKAGGRFRSVNSIGVESGDILYAAVDDYMFNYPTISRSTNLGKTWDRIYLVGERIATCNRVVIPRPGQMFFGSTSSGVQESTDGGLAWGGMIGDVFEGFSPLNNGPLYAAMDHGVYRYLPEKDSFLPLGPYGGYAVTSKPNGIVFLGRNRYDGPLYRYTEQNGFGSWAESDSGLPFQSVSSLLVNRKGDVLAGTTNGIYRSTNDGASWEATSMTTGFFMNLLLLPQGDIIAGTSWASVFRSTDDGDSWIDISDGLPNDPVMCLALLSDGRLIAGTQAYGVYVTTTPLTSIVHDKPTPSSYSLFQNFPNPFNPTTTIRYGLPTREHVTLRVFNTLGQEVTVLINESEEAGYHEVKFDGGGLASGMYFYRLSAGDYAETKKLLLVH